TEHAPRAGELRSELRQGHVADALARLRGRDRGAIRDDELDVAAALGEEQVARPQPREADRPAYAQLIPARAREHPPDRAVGRVTRPEQSKPVRGEVP